MKGEFMSSRLGRFTTLVVLSSAVALVAAAPASAGYVSGQQKLVNERAGKFKMKGDLLGKWKVTSFKTTHQNPVFKGKGKEKFRGCIDVNGDRSCAGDPSGVMRFRFRFWGVFGEDGGTLLGTCAHPVVKGKGDFANATGFLMMVDRPKSSAPFVKTHYEGVIDLDGSAGRAASRGAPPHC